MPVAHINGKRVLFMHVPKVAGTTVTEFLRKNGEIFFDEVFASGRRKFHPRHQPAEVVRQCYQFADFDFIFMITRHPAARLVSEYSYQKTPKRGRQGSKAARLLPFSLWLRYSMARYHHNPAYRDNHFRPQHEYEIENCTIFRLEEGIEKVLKQVANATGLAAPGRITKINEAVESTIDLSAPDLALIKKVYDTDFVRYGYDPDQKF